MFDTFSDSVALPDSISLSFKLLSICKSTIYFIYWVLLTNAMINMISGQNDIYYYSPINDCYSFPTLFTILSSPSIYFQFIDLDTIKTYLLSNIMFVGYFVSNSYAHSCSLFRFRYLFSYHLPPCRLRVISRIISKEYVFIRTSAL